MNLGCRPINNQLHCFYWDEESGEIQEEVGLSEVVIGYAKSEAEARAFIEF